MGAARYTQRAQEHAQRRIARSAPTQEETLASMDREYAELVDDYIELKKQRDRLRAVLDAVWPILDNGQLLPQNRSEAARNCLASRGFGGDQ